MNITNNSAALAYQKPYKWLIDEDGFLWTTSANFQEVSTYGPLYDPRGVACWHRTSRQSRPDRTDPRWVHGDIPSPELVVEAHKRYTAACKSAYDAFMAEVGPRGQ